MVQITKTCQAIGQEAEVGADEDEGAVTFKYLLRDIASLYRVLIGEGTAKLLQRSPKQETKKNLVVEKE